MNKISSSLDIERKKKRGCYSKNGCRECKRRKIKCDEGKPQCWQCERLRKTCTYPGIGEKVMRVSRREMMEPSQVQVASLQEKGGIEIYSINDVRLSQSMERNFASSLNGSREAAVAPQEDTNMIYPSPTSILKLLNDSQILVSQNHYNSDHPNQNLSPSDSLKSNNSSSRKNHSSHLSSFSSNREDLSIFGDKSTHNVEKETTKSVDSELFQDINQEDLTLLASDLNSIVNNMMPKSHFEDRSAEDSFIDDLFLNEDEALNSHNDSPPTKNLDRHGEEKVLVRNIPFDYIKVKMNHEKLYLEEFFNDFANIILPFNSYDQNLNCYFNPARDILLDCASRESFLLAAVLAQGAKTCYKKNLLPEDEEASCKYLSRCLKLLEPAILKSHKMNDPSILTSNIETVLLTVLLLTSSNASNKNQDWRPHLRGAKDILLKHSSSKYERYSKLKDSKVLVFCKFWFISLEILAGLSSKRGGTLKTEEELDLILNPGSLNEIRVLKELGLMKDNGFNLLCGFHGSCVTHLRDLIKLLNKARNERERYIPDTFQCLRLLSEFYKQAEITFIQAGGIVKLSEFQNGNLPKGQLLDITILDNEKYVISWMDTSHLSYVLASIITIFSKGFQMSYDSPHVQAVSSKLVSLISFLEKIQDTPLFIKSSMIIIQWPMFVAGMNCINEDQKFLIMKLFRLSAQIGSESAIHALKMMNRAWKIHSSTSCHKEESDAIDDDIDIVTY
ncbi:uncharacterized protein PRCAT00004347001 [Priceomyces carsonii]|uniref:uncharacterized protein n=1 Tax=Priceomyces carsonii TaxID=28549 RepID=UPI002ED90E42|nr:unnamed protein product [Priceomyces carsonii]